MRDIWRLSGIAVVFIVLLRVAIGWQFVYEGLWKLNTFSSAKPWTSAGYLRNAHGPLRSFYRGMTGDPDDLHWLDYDQVAASWDAYRDAFVAEHPDLTEAQKLRLSEMLDGPAQFAVPLAKLPAGVKFTRQPRKSHFLRRRQQAAGRRRQAASAAEGKGRAGAHGQELPRTPTLPRPSVS